MNYEKLFIAGCARSGTSWVFSFFWNHPSVITIPESESRTYEDILPPFSTRKVKGDKGWRHILENYDRIFLETARRIPIKRTEYRDPFGKLPAWVSRIKLERFIDKVKGRNDLDDVGKAELVINNIFDDVFRRKHGTKKHLFVEKTPRHLFYAERILDRYPESKFVEVIRDGRDVCVSFQMRSKYDKSLFQDRKHQIWVWKEYIKKGLELRSNIKYKNRILSVYYEKIKKDPIHEIKKLYDFAGINSSPRLIKDVALKTNFLNIKNSGNGKFYRKGVVGDWRNYFTANDIKLFKHDAGKLLTQMGYKW